MSLYLSVQTGLSLSLSHFVSLFLSLSLSIYIYIYIYILLPNSPANTLEPARHQHIRAFFSSVYKIILWKISISHTYLTVIASYKMEPYNL